MVCIVVTLDGLVMITINLIVQELLHNFEKVRRGRYMSFWFFFSLSLPGWICFLSRIKAIYIALVQSVFVKILFHCGQLNII